MTQTDPFPEVRTRVELGAAPAREWIECAGCLEHESVGDPRDQMFWAERHAKAHPGHNRFRTVRQSNFRIAPTGFAVPVGGLTEDDPVCGVTEIIPSDPEWLAQFGFEPYLGNVVVTCSESPHTCAEGYVVHCGHILGDDGETVTGTYYWGPGYRPTSLVHPPEPAR
jgi:hypothetical protein